MSSKQQEAAGSSKTVRTSVTLETEDYNELQRIADQKKVSVAWVVRHAVDRYLADESPLFKKTPR